MSRFDPLLGSRRDELGAQIADVRAEIASAKDQTAQITATTVQVPVVDNTFSPIFTKGNKKNKIFVTLRYADFGTANDIKVVLVPRASILTSDDYDNLRITSKLTEAPFSDAIIAVQLVTSPMEVQFEPNTQYDIIRLVAIGKSGEDRAVNPTPDPTFAGYPGNVLYTFTTPEAIGAPSGPNASLIVFNRLDEHTPDEGDAEVGLKVYAPLTSGGAAQTFAAAAGTGNAVKVKCWLTRAITGDVALEQLPFEKTLSETELTQTDPASSPANRGYVVVVCNNLKAGAPYTWTDNVVIWGVEKNTSSGSVAFNAAGFQTNLSNLTGVSLTFDNAVPYDDFMVAVDLNFTQPATPVALRNFTLRRKLSTDGSYPATNVIDRSDKVNSDAYHVAGSFTVRLTEIKVKPSKTYNVQVVLRTRGNGTPLTINGTFSTAADGHILMDTAAPSGLATPLLEWTAEGRFRVQGMQATTNIHTLKERYLVITDNAGNYLNLTTGLVTTNEASARYATGNKGHINLSHLRLKKYRTAFGSSTTIYAYWYAENDVGVSSASSLSTGVNLATPEDYLGDRSTVRGVDIEVTQLSPMNVLLNGDLFIESSVANECDSFFLRQNTTYPIQGANRITTSSSNLRWDRATHSLRWLTNSREICLPLKQRLEPAGYYTLTFMIRSDTTGWSTTPSFHIYNGQRTTAVDNIVDTIDTQITFNDTSYHLFYAVLQFTTATGATLTAALESAGGAGDYAAHFLCIDLNTVSHDVFMDKFMLVRGQSQMAYAPNGEEANVSLPTTVSISSVTFPDFVSIGGTVGGRFDPNDGGIVDFQSY